MRVVGLCVLVTGLAVVALLILPACGATIPLPRIPPPPPINTTPEQTLRHTPDQIWPLAFNRDGTRLASGGRDGSVWIEGPGTPQEIKRKRAIDALAFSPTSDLLAIASGDEVEVYDVVADKTVAQIRLKGLRCIAYAPDARTIALGTTSGAVSLWDIATGAARPLPAKVGLVSSLAFSPDGSLLLVGGSRERTQLWDLKTSSLKGTYPADGWVNTALFAPAADQLVVAGSKAIRFFNVGSDRPLHRVDMRTAAVRYDAGTQQLVAATPDGDIYLVDLQGNKGKPRHVTNAGVTSLAVTPDGRRWAVGTMNGTILVFYGSDLTGKR